MGSKTTPAGVTTTTQNTNATNNSATGPWSVQQPYLQAGFGQAQNLFQNYTPQYYPSSTYSAQNPAQTAALSSIYDSAGSLLNGPIEGNAYGAQNYFDSGANTQQDPTLQYLMQLTGLPNAGLPSANNPGATDLNSFAGGNYVNPGQAFANAPGSNTLNSFASGAQTNPWGAVEGSPGAGTLNYFASGAATDPFLSNVAQSTLANVVPSIESQFINGGSLSSPQAAYATSQGATAALAPVISSALQQEQQNQLSAGSQLGNNYLSALLGQQGNQLAAGTSSTNDYLNTLLGQQGMQYGASGQLASNYLTGQGLQNTAGANAASAYSADQQKQLAALGMFPQTAAGIMSLPQDQYAAAAAQQGLSQQQLNAAVNAYNYYQTLPYQQLAQYMGSIGGNYGSTTTGTSTGTGTLQQPYYINQPANILSGALGLTGIGTGLFGSSGLFPGALSGIGSAIGSILPSDRRLKTDIARIGELPNGLPVYSFRFYGDDELRIGLMSDDVAKVHPEAVARGPYGLEMVNYARAMQ